MKGKNQQIFLLIAVAMIWGSVIYRFVSGSGGDSDNVAPIPIHTSTIVSKGGSKYAYSLKYKDPFLKYSSLAQPTPATRPTTSRRQPIKRQPKRPPQLPSVKLLGVVHSGQDMIGLLDVQSRQFMAKKGEEVGDYQILEIRAKQVELRYIPLDSVVVVGVE